MLRENRDTRQRAFLMSSEFRYALLAVGGVICGLIARVLSFSIRGRFAKRVLIHRFVDEIAVVPSIALVLWLVPLGEPSRFFESGALMGVFALAYTVTRLSTHKWAVARSNRREEMVPFSHWLELMRTDPQAAEQFLKAYLGDRTSDALSELRVAEANFARRGSEEPHVLAALNQLRVEIARRETVLPRAAS